MGRDLLHLLQEHQLYLSSVCGGRGSCGKCRIIVTRGRGALNPPSKAEHFNLTKREVGEGYRLACQSRLLLPEDITLEIPPESRVEPQRMLIAGLMVPVEPAPPLRRYTVTLSKPTLEDPRSDAERLLDALKDQVDPLHLRFSLEALQEIPHLLRGSGWRVGVVVRNGEEVISVDKGGEKLWGMAVDIGTTKLAGYLVDLTTGKTVSTASLLNPQLPFGGDVASRISYVMQGEGNLRELQQMVVQAVRELVERVCREVGIDGMEVYEMTVVGNTVMHHLFLGVTPKYVAVSPYLPTVGRAMEVRVKELDVGINPSGYVYMLPNIAGFVGADAVADILCSRIHRAETLSMMIDIGTNTEIVLGNRERLMACSTPAGPAIEGAHIKDGMRAEVGAMEHVWIEPEGLEPGYKTIGGVKPRGLCGSAIIDAVAHMFKVGLLDSAGGFRVETDSPRVRRLEGGWEYVLEWEDRTVTGRAISITSQDVREIQLAKAAIRSGVNILVETMGVRVEEIGRVYLAGAFGTYVDPQSARTLGMYPEVPLSNVVFIGNAAGSGARMALLSTRVREEAEEIRRRIEYVELAASPHFQEEFIRSLFIPYKG